MESKSKVTKLTTSNKYSDETRQRYLECDWYAPIETGIHQGKPNLAVLLFNQEFFDYLRTDKAFTTKLLTCNFNQVIQHGKYKDEKLVMLLARHIDFCEFALSVPELQKKILKTDWDSKFLVGDYAGATLTWWLAKYTNNFQRLIITNHQFQEKLSSHSWYAAPVCGPQTGESFISHLLINAVISVIANSQCLLDKLKHCYWDQPPHFASNNRLSVLWKLVVDKIGRQIIFSDQEFVKKLLASDWDNAAIRGDNKGISVLWWLLNDKNFIQLIKNNKVAQEKVANCNWQAGPESSADNHSKIASLLLEQDCYIDILEESPAWQKSLLQLDWTDYQIALLLVLNRPEFFKSKQNFIEKLVDLTCKKNYQLDEMYFETSELKTFYQCLILNRYQQLPDDDHIKQYRKELSVTFEKIEVLIEGYFNESFFAKSNDLFRLFLGCAFLVVQPNFSCFTIDYILKIINPVIDRYVNSMKQASANWIINTSIKKRGIELKPDTEKKLTQQLINNYGNNLLIKSNKDYLSGKIKVMPENTNYERLNLNTFSP